VAYRLLLLEDTNEWVSLQASTSEQAAATAVPANETNRLTSAIDGVPVLGPHTTTSDKLGLRSQGI
jgi:hypothetical protein